jgi:hypothetical protein
MLSLLWLLADWVRGHATLPGVHDEPMGRIARLLHERNAIDEEIAAITGRPMTSGHLGEWVASRIFDIELEPSAAAAGITASFAPRRCGVAPSISSGT